MSFVDHLISTASRLNHRIRYHPSDILPALQRFVGFLGRRAKLWQSSRKAKAGSGYLEHYGVHMPRNNAGDVVLFDAVERLFDYELGPFEWNLNHLRSPVGNDDVNRINRAAKGVVVGGGGLFMKVNDPNSQSGWQWNISSEELDRLEPPLILFAVGYNQFRGSAPFGPQFEPHLQATVEKASFIGLRNSGSIQGLKSHLPEHLHSKLSFQPCMTTFLKYYYPAAQTAPNPDSKDVVVNLAFDQRDLRFAGQDERILSELGRVLRHAIQAGYKLHAAVHSWDDNPMVEFFKRERIPANIKRLNLDSPQEIVKFYARAPLTIGMRGHAQMIPFGCGNAIYSIISHNKMRYFLDDLGQPDWGSDVTDPKFADKAIAFLDTFEDNRANIEANIATKQEEFWRVTRNNLAAIGKAFNS